MGLGKNMTFRYIPIDSKDFIKTTGSFNLHGMETQNGKIVSISFVNINIGKEFVLRSNGEGFVTVAERIAEISPKEAI